MIMIDSCGTVHEMFKEQKCCVQDKWYQVQGWRNSKTFTNRVEKGLVLFFSFIAKN